MDPSQSYLNSQPVPMVQTYDGFMPGAFINDGNNFLASLDSDTRDYVLKHTDKSRSNQDIVDCINELKRR